jgi:signal transduction histidine kinase
MYLPAPPTVYSAENRVINFMRSLLALSALLIVLIKPEQLYTTQIWVIGLLLLLSCYSLALDIFWDKSLRIERFATSGAHWVDVIFCAALVAVSGGVTSIFFLGFIFPILISSIRFGFVTGLRVTLVSVAGFAVISLFAPAVGQPEFEMDRLLVKSIWLLPLGYMMAYWGESKIVVRRRLEFIERMRKRSNPRFGIERTIGSMLHDLRRHYGAQSCVMLFNDKDGKGYRFQRANNEDSESAMGAEPIAGELAVQLLEMPFDTAAVYNAKPEGLWPFGRLCQELDLALDRMTSVHCSALSPIAAILGTACFLSVPVRYRSQNMGRIYILAQNPVFVPSDMRFLHQIVTDAGSTLENIFLVEQLAEHAADDERRRIAWDIHDSIIQPYIGLQMGLAALLQKTGDHFPDMAQQIQGLMDMTQAGINDLRRYVTGLKDAEESDGGLIPAMRRFAAKFTDATGIDVKILTEGDILANARLASEAFQMAAEGLSNIRKHTQATGATVRLACRLGHLTLEIAEEGAGRTPGPGFAPDSIMERATLLGGKVRVKPSPEGGTAVVVDIPL